MKTGVITKFEKNGLGELEAHTTKKTYKFHASVIVNSNVTYTDILITDDLLTKYTPGTKVEFKIVKVLLKEIAIDINKIDTYNF